MAAEDNGLVNANETATIRRVQETLDDMHQNRKTFLRALNAGAVTKRNRMQFQSTLIDCITEIRPFKSRSKSWESKSIRGRSLDKLPEWLIPTRKTTLESRGFGRKKWSTTVEPSLLDDKDLIELSFAIDDVANEIGFEPNPKKANPDDVSGGRL